MDSIKKSEWQVKPIGIELGRALIEKFHYARGAANTATYLHGLIDSVGECKGCAWWIPPTKSAAFATFPENWKGVLALSRLVITPDALKNACSFLLSKSVKMIDKNRWPCLVTYADTWRGHKGIIYRACGWSYRGLTKPEATYTLNGRMIARKAGPKTRTHSEMLLLGAKFEGRFAKHKFILIR